MIIFFIELSKSKQKFFKMEDYQVLKQENEVLKETLVDLQETVTSLLNREKQIKRIFKIFKKQGLNIHEILLNAEEEESEDESTNLLEEQEIKKCFKRNKVEVNEGNQVKEEFADESSN